MTTRAWQRGDSDAAWAEFRRACILAAEDPDATVEAHYDGVGGVGAAQLHGHPRAIPLSAVEVRGAPSRALSRATITTRVA